MKSKPQGRRKNSVTAIELRDRTAELIDRAMSDPEHAIVVVKRGTPAVVLVDARHFEGLLATLELLADPQAMRLLRRGMEDERHGRLIPHEQLMKELRLDRRSPVRRRSKARRRRRVSTRN